MRNRDQAITYGIATACIVALLLLIVIGPSGGALSVSIGIGLLVSIGSFLYLSRH